MSAFKLVVIGAGPGGYAAGIRARQLGAEVVLIEKDRPGGTCLHRGCLPSKIMKRTAELARDAAGAEAFGLIGGGTFEVRMDRLRVRQKKIIDDQTLGLTRHFQALGLKLVHGAATVEKTGTVRVDLAAGGAERYDYDQLLVATGSTPASLPGLELDGEKIISSDQALWLEDRPASLLVVGGGVIGCELAQIFHDFGTRVTIVEALPRLLPLPGLDEEISKNYMRSLKKLKLPFFTGHTVADIRETAGGLTAAIRPVSGEGEPRELEVERVLVAVGRRPALEGLAALNPPLDSRGWVEAGEDFRTGIPGVWAIGDCLGPARVMLAHVATAEGLAAAENMFGGHKTVNYQCVPSAVFTHPEVGCVGLALAQAEERHPGSRANDFLFRQLGQAQALGEIDGLVRLVSGPEGRVLGGHILGAAATSLVAEIGLAVTKGLTVNDLADTIHAHPTLPEGIWEAALAATGRPLHG